MGFFFFFPGSKREIKVAFAGAEMASESRKNASPSETPQPPRNYGITKPIFLSGPSQSDLQRNIELEKVHTFMLVYFGDLKVWGLICKLMILFTFFLFSS